MEQFSPLCLQYHTFLKFHLNLDFIIAFDCALRCYVHSRICLQLEFVSPRCFPAFANRDFPMECRKLGEVIVTAARDERVETGAGCWLMALQFDSKPASKISTRCMLGRTTASAGHPAHVRRRPLMWRSPPPPRQYTVLPERGARAQRRYPSPHFSRKSALGAGHTRADGRWTRKALMSTFRGKQA